MLHQRTYSDGNAQTKQPRHKKSNSFKLFTKMNQSKQPVTNALSSDSFDSFGTPSYNDECIPPQLPSSWFQFLQDNQNTEEKQDFQIGLDNYLPTEQRVVVAQHMPASTQEGLLVESAQFGSSQFDEVCQQSTDATVGYSYEGTTTIAGNQSSNSSTQTIHYDSQQPYHCCHCNVICQQQFYALNEQYLQMSQRLLNVEALLEETQLKSNEEKNNLIELTVSMGRSILALTQLLEQRNSKKSHQNTQEENSSDNSILNESIMSPPAKSEIVFNRSERNWTRLWAGI